MKFTRLVKAFIYLVGWPRHAGLAVGGFYGMKAPDNVAS